MTVPDYTTRKQHHGSVEREEFQRSCVPVMRITPFERFTPGSERYSRVWKDFLEDLVAHLMEKGWFEESYIGIDERGFTSAAFDLIES